ncbi:MAG: hypothetical protein II143_07980, partial [Bacteroidales bacterium]|nr:hypothetical protein [Bacteroidales bacterium]
MKINPKLLAEIVSDLGLNIQFVKGESKTIRNCWHFSTDGNAVDAMFYDEADFVAGMNRIYVTLKKYNVVILAFILMDTHIHFILYGEFDECNRFVHDYIRRTSWYISTRHKQAHKLDGLPVSHQAVDTDTYLKTVICYTIKNAPVGEIAFNAWNYPWSSGALYFQRAGYWTSPAWIIESQRAQAGNTGHVLSGLEGSRLNVASQAPGKQSAAAAGLEINRLNAASQAPGKQSAAASGLEDNRPDAAPWQCGSQGPGKGSNLANSCSSAHSTVKDRQRMLRTRDPELLDAPMIGDLVYPGEYVAYEIVERIFRSCKSMNYFLCKSKEDDVDSRGGLL